jgi:hypothetical protein
MSKNKDFDLNSTEALRLIALLKAKGYKETDDIIEMLDDMSYEYNNIKTTVDELINGLFMFDRNIGIDADSKWDDIKKALVESMVFGNHAVYFFSAHRLKYDDIPEDADEDEVRTSHAITLLEKLWK